MNLAKVQVALGFMFALGVALSTVHPWGNPRAGIHPDAPLLGRTPAGVPGVVRMPAPGELYQYHLDRLAWVDAMVASHGVRRALTAQDIAAAHAAGQPVIVMDIEGFDFLERKFEHAE